MFILIKNIFKWLGREDLFEKQFTQFVVNYAEDLYDSYGKTELINALNPLLESVELKLVDTETYKRMISK